MLTGFSNGAHLVQSLGYRLAGRVSAIVPVGGTLAPSAAASCEPAHSLNVVEFHGTSDPIDPFDGGRIHVPGGGQVLPVPLTMNDWARWDHCGALPRDTVAGTPAGGVTVTRRDYPGCTGGVRVSLYEMAGAGHVWPGGPQYLPRFLIGRATHVVDASEVIARLAAGGP